MQYTLLNKNITITDEELTALIQQRIQQRENSLFWFPKENEPYYYHDSIGDIYQSVWGSCDNRRLIVGNVFQSKDACFKFLERRKARVRVRDYIKKNSLYFRPDWSDDKQVKYFIAYSHEFNLSRNLPGFVVHATLSTKHSFSGLFFRAQKDAQLIIDKMDYDLRILFGLETPTTQTPS